MMAPPDNFELFPGRLGLFIHWGIYALHGYHEQEQQRLGIPRADYAKLAREFRADGFDADAWASFAAENGFEYLVLTTKHHDGFCLWDTAETDFQVMHTPLARDVVGEIARACAARGVRLGLYYSCVDWRHPAYPNEGRHHELDAPEPGDRPDREAYLDFVRRQVRELCDGRYGALASFWWDMNVPGWQDPSINAIIRQLQPGCLINDRGYDAGDFSTRERHYAAREGNEVDPARRIESCDSVGALSWGYKADEDYQTPRHLEQSIASRLAGGGNFLLNVGPDARGHIPAGASAVAAEVAAWFRRVREAFTGVQAVHGLLHHPGLLATRKGNSLHVIDPHPPSSNGLRLRPIDRLPRRVVLLNTGQDVEAVLDRVPFESRLPRKFLRLRNLPVDLLQREVPVFRLEFETAPDDFADHGDIGEKI